MVVVIDYGMGNLRSVLNALAALGYEAHSSQRPEDLRDADRIILPGVGAFGDGMHNLRSAGWVEALEEEVRRKGKPFLGICLGMQLLATTGTEHGLHQGLNWIPGVVRRIPGEDFSLRVPHIGWNEVRFAASQGLYHGLGSSRAFYFVHSFILFPEEQTIVNGTCSYGIDFAASIEKDNLFATQFHPEKSHKDGLLVLKNFLEVRP